jgi:hypothetical protein
MPDKAGYYSQLRQEWQQAKDTWEANKDYQVLYDNAVKSGVEGMSRYSFMFTKLQMEAKGLEGMPYLDAKTFKGWMKNGYCVNKGEHSLLTGIVWRLPKVKVEGKWVDDDDDNNYRLPMVYKLFHKTQVSPLKAKGESYEMAEAKAEVREEVDQVIKEGKAEVKPEVKAEVKVEAKVKKAAKAVIYQLDDDLGR